MTGREGKGCNGKRTDGARENRSQNTVSERQFMKSLAIWRIGWPWMPNTATYYLKLIQTHMIEARPRQGQDSAELDTGRENGEEGEGGQSG